MVFFLLKGYLISRLTKPVELSHEWVKTNFNYQEPEFYSVLFVESENGPFEFPAESTNTYEKSVPDAHKLYVLQENKSAYVFLFVLLCILINW